MKYLKTVLLIIILSSHLPAQKTLNGPEAVVYDAVHNRYLVVNAFSGTVVQVDEDGNQENFITGLTTPIGACIHNDLFYVTTNDPNNLCEYNLNGDLLRSIPLLESSSLASVCADDQGFL